MTKYIAVIDYNAALKKGFGHIQLEAKTLLDAMNEAEKLLTDDVYLVDIAEKSGKTEKVDGGKETLFTDILRNRGNGWHRCDAAHGEYPAIWKMFQAKWGECFEIAGHLI